MVLLRIQDFPVNCFNHHLSKKVVGFFLILRSHLHIPFEEFIDFDVTQVPLIGLGVEKLIIIVQFYEVFERFLEK